MVWLFGTLSVLFFLLSCALAFFVRKFALIIMIAEDDYENAIDVLIQAEERLEGILSMQLFFETPEVRSAVDGAIEEVKLSRIEIVKAAERFVARSNQKYILVQEETQPPILPESMPQGMDYVGPEQTS